MKKTRMLVSDTAPLYPPLWGGPKRIWNLYGNFARCAFDIVYVGIKTDKQGDLAYQYKRITENIEEFDCSFPSHYRLWHACEWALFRNTSLNLFLYLAAGSVAQFRDLLRSQDADVIICSHPWSFPAVQMRAARVYVYDAHNCEYLLMRQILRGHPLSFIVCAWVKKIEEEACRKSDLIVVCSEKEKKDFLDIYGLDPARIMIVPNGSSVRPVTSENGRIEARAMFAIPADSRVVLFIGAYYKPNNDAARLIVDRIAPAMPEITFVIAGTVKDHFKGAAIPGNVKFLGRLDEEHLAAALRGADIAINPMMEGSGINIKMLDYMAYGLPCVTTPCGSRGIDTGGFSPYFVTGVSGFAGAIRRMFSEPALLRAMSRDARSLVAGKYEWTAISKELESKIRQLLGKS